MCHKQVVIEEVSYLDTQNASLTILLFSHSFEYSQKSQIQGGAWPIPDFSLVRILDYECRFLVALLDDHLTKV